jgi:glycosyltransferase involved in cell wall biosynthesis
VIEDVFEDAEGALTHAVSVVIPAYNEAAHIAQQIRDVEAVLRESGWTFEIIVVDDGSRDRTADEAEATGARVLRRRPNRGYGAALKLGIHRSRYDWILITDADGTYPASAIPQLLAAADRNAMVVGARTGGTVQVPMIRRPAKAFLRWLASYLSERDIPDINSGLRLMRKDLVRRYEHLLPNGFSFTTTITLAANCNGHPVEYIPIDYLARLGESKIRARHAYDFALLTLRTIVYFNPLRVFIPVGAVLTLAGLAKLSVDMVKVHKFSGSVVISFLAALIIWAVGLLADQNARIAMRR